MMILSYSLKETSTIFGIGGLCFVGCEMKTNDDIFTKPGCRIHLFPFKFLFEPPYCVKGICAIKLANVAC